MYRSTSPGTEYNRVAVPFIVLSRPNILSFSSAQSFPSFQNKDMRIVARVATKVTRGPARVRLGLLRDWGSTDAIVVGTFFVQLELELFLYVLY